MRRISIVAIAAAFLIFSAACACTQMAAAGVETETAGYNAGGSSPDEAGKEDEEQTDPGTDSGERNQEDPENDDGDGKRTDTGTDGGDGKRTDTGNDGGDGKRTDTGTDGGDEGQTDTGTDGGGESQTDPENDDTGDGEDDGDDTVYDRSLWTEEELSRKPKGKWTVSVTDLKADLPKEGRYYDGTDDISVTFDTKAVSETDENVPAYRIECESKLDGIDAGERKAVCVFTLKTPWPGRVKLAPESERQEIKITVKKAVLHVRIADGVKKYGEPAEIDNIDFGNERIVSVTGFVKDENGSPVIPYGFVEPEAEVNSEVLEKFSPIYETDVSDKNQNTVRKYKNAVILKKRQGKITGNPTGNYEFCTDTDDRLCRNGTVTIERAGAAAAKEYEIYGQEGNIINESSGTVIVRQASSIRVKPLNGSGYSEEYVSQPLFSDGTLTLRLQKKDSSGCLLADSLKISVQYRVDSSAPEAVISYPEVQSGSYSDGTLYSNAPVSFGYSIPEDDLSGIQSVRVRTVKSETGGEYISLSGDGGTQTAGPWQENGTRGAMTVSDEGIWRIEAEVTDRVGNVRLTAGPAAVIDTSPPEIKIDGVSDGSANAGEVNLSASCSDPAYMRNTLRANLTAHFTGAAPSYEVTSEDARGGILKFDPFPRTKAADAFYTLKVTASDLAGNSSEETVSFSINRFGSSYGLSERCAKELESYYHREPFDVVFTETNLDEVGGARVLMRKGRQLSELTPGDGITVDGKLTDQGAHQYTYTVSAGTFDTDGNYEVMLLTEDAAGNTADSSSQKLPVRFAIDSTPPECLVSGLNEKQIIKQEKMTVAAQLRDNLELDLAQVYLNSARSAAYTEEQLKENGGVIKISFYESDDWQTLQIYARDKAGNESWTKEIPFLLTTDEETSAVEYRPARLSAQQLALAVSKIEQWRTKLERLGKTWKRAAPAAADIHLRSESVADGGMNSLASMSADIFSEELPDRKIQGKTEHKGHPAIIAMIAALCLSIAVIFLRAVPGHRLAAGRKNGVLKR